MTGIVQNIATKMTNERDEYIFKALERFGITKDNFTEYRSRIMVYTWQDVNTGVRYERYNLDDRPIFSVVSWTELDMDSEHMSYKATYNTKIVFFEEVEK